MTLKAYVYAAVMLAISAAGTTASAKTPVETKGADGSIVINTTELCPTVKGLMGPTPVEVFIRNGKIVKVKPLANKETPKYFRLLTNAGLFNKWNGMTVKKAATAEVDAVTGATYSSKAVIANVRAAAKHAMKKK